MLHDVDVRWAVRWGTWGYVGERVVRGTCPHVYGGLVGGVVGRRTEVGWHIFLRFSQKIRNQLRARETGKK